MNGSKTTPSRRLQRVASGAVQDLGAQIGAGAAAATGAALDAGRAAVNATRSNGKPGPSRAYRLKKKEKTAKGVRRVARGRVEDALEQLREQPHGEVEAVHTARKDLKKLRSLLRLVRGELGRSTYREENRRYRDAGRALSGARDAEVRLQTLEALHDRSDDLGDIGDYEAALHMERERSGDGAAEAAARAIELGGEQIADWNLPSGSWAPDGGLARAYARGRAALAEVRSGGGTDETVHEWRKRSKDLWYHLRLLKPVWPEVLEPLADQAHELSDLLGDHHDLAILRADARESGHLDGDQEALTSAIRTRQDELLAEALPLGERLYAEKPKAYQRRMKAYWKAAHR